MYNFWFINKYWTLTYKDSYTMFIQWLNNDFFSNKCGCRYLNDSCIIFPPILHPGPVHVYPCGCPSLHPDKQSPMSRSHDSVRLAQLQGNRQSVELPNKHARKRKQGWIGLYKYSSVNYYHKCPTQQIEDMTTKMTYDNKKCAFEVRYWLVIQCRVSVNMF